MIYAKNPDIAPEGVLITCATKRIIFMAFSLPRRGAESAVPLRDQ